MTQNFDKTTLTGRFLAINAQVPPTTTLLAVSKTKPSTDIRTLFEIGQRDFGENYLQEALIKMDELADLDIVWHYIGHIQRNKTKQLAQNFAWVHGVDRLMIAQRLSKHLSENTKDKILKDKTLNICIQVNIDNQDSKSGCQLDELPALVAQISQLPNLSLRGLMIIPDPSKDSTTAFKLIKQAFDDCKKQHANPSQWDTLSMGMSGDMAQAMLYGSTLVRVGSAIFGER